MISSLTVNVTLDVKQYLNVSRFAKKNRSILSKTAAQEYVKFLRARYIVNASGGGDWEALKSQTIERKRRRGVATNPEWILREYDAILNSLGIRTRGQLVYAGFVRERNHPRGPSVNQLVIIHSEGLGTAPVRQVIVLPDNSVRKRMADSVRKEYNRIIRRNRTR